MESQVTYASSGAVLVVDDEPEIRRVVSAVLTRAGYPVFLADSGESAIKSFHKHADQITLLLTDVVAPGMSGPVLADQLREACPHLKIVYMSGYNDTVVVRRFVVERGFPLLIKPFTSERLLFTIRGAIGPPVRQAG